MKNTCVTNFFCIKLTNQSAQIHKNTGDMIASKNEMYANGLRKTNLNLIIFCKK